MPLVFLEGVDTRASFLNLVGVTVIRGAATELLGEPLDRDAVEKGAALERNLPAPLAAAAAPPPPPFPP